MSSEAPGIAVGPGGRWTLHEARAAQDAELLDLFAQAFGHRLAPQQWRWKYEGADARGVLLRREGRPVAFFGGMPRVMRGPWGEVRTVQNGDVMVEPAERAVFTREGALYQVAAAFFERMVGVRRPHALAFGFPSDRHIRLGMRLGLYHGGPRMLTLTWAPWMGRAPLWRREEELAAQALPELDALGAAMGNDWPDYLIPVRDAARWRHRYLEHPSHRHVLLAVRGRWRRELRCALALRLHADRVDWLDYAGPAAEAPHAVAAARRLAAREGKPLSAVVSELLAPVFGASALTQAPAMQIACAWNSDSRCLQTPMWLMGGDTDFL